jgi:hypothetical protein
MSAVARPARGRPHRFGVHRLLDKPGEGKLRDMAVWKTEGHTSQHIAERLGCALATAERRLRILGELWEGESTGRGGWPA